MICEPESLSSSVGTRIEVISSGHMETFWLIVRAVRTLSLASVSRERCCGPRLCWFPNRQRRWLNLIFDFARQVRNESIRRFVDNNNPTRSVRLVPVSDDANDFRAASRIQGASH